MGPINSRHRGRDLTAIPPFAIRNLDPKGDREFEFILNHCNKRKRLSIVVESSSIYNVFDYIDSPLACLDHRSPVLQPNSARYL